ncbi:MAG: hypothetical protein K9M56_04295 [Victivallales bacterium]|nr:hypothetical protein [Victivallales bacterium]
MLTDNMDKNGAPLGNDAGNAPDTKPGTDTSSQPNGNDKGNDAPNSETPSGGKEKTGNEGTPTGKENGGNDNEYEFNFPEGFTPDEDGLNEYKKLVKEAGLDNEKAQALIDLSSKNIQKIIPGIKEQFQTEMAQHLQEKIAENEKVIKSDSVLGGDKLEGNLENAREVLSSYAPDGLKSKLDENGLGSDPDFFRFVLNISNAMKKEPAFADSVDHSNNTKRSTAELMYPTMSSNN